MRAGGTMRAVRTMRALETMRAVYVDYITVMNVILKLSYRLLILRTVRINPKGRAPH